MPRFFVRSDAVCDNIISIVGDDARHIARSLRMAQGENITICDMQSSEYKCKILSISDILVKSLILEKHKIDAEPPFKAKLFQALPKGDKLDVVIQKSVECGVYSITPFVSEHCVVKYKKEDEGRKNERRNRIAYEAAKQCGRGIIPEVLPTLDFQNMLNIAKQSELCLFCYEGDNTVPLGSVLRRFETSPIDISVIIGSEGGFSLNEVNEAGKLGITAVGLGKRILRTETASTFVLSALCYEFEL